MLIPVKFDGSYAIASNCNNNSNTPKMYLFVGGRIILEWILISKCRDWTELVSSRGAVVNRLVKVRVP
jgi:hypothetical protein